MSTVRAGALTLLSVGIMADQGGDPTAVLPAVDVFHTEQAAGDPAVQPSGLQAPEGAEAAAQAAAAVAARLVAQHRGAGEPGEGQVRGRWDGQFSWNDEIVPEAPWGSAQLKHADHPFQRLATFRRRLRYFKRASKATASAQERAQRQTMSCPTRRRHPRAIWLTRTAATLPQYSGCVERGVLRGRWPCLPSLTERPAAELASATRAAVHQPAPHTPPAAAGAGAAASRRARRGRGRGRGHGGAGRARGAGGSPHRQVGRDNPPAAGDHRHEDPGGPQRRGTHQARDHQRRQPVRAVAGWRAGGEAPKYRRSTLPPRRLRSRPRRLHPPGPGPRPQASSGQVPRRHPGAHCRRRHNDHDRVPRQRCRAHHRARRRDHPRTAEREPGAHHGCGMLCCRCSWNARGEGGGCRQRPQGERRRHPRRPPPPPPPPAVDQNYPEGVPRKVIIQGGSEACRRAQVGWRSGRRQRGRLWCCATACGSAHPLPSGPPCFASPAR